MIQKNSNNNKILNSSEHYDLKSFVLEDLALKKYEVYNVMPLQLNEVNKPSNRVKKTRRKLQLKHQMEY